MLAIIGTQKSVVGSFRDHNLRSKIMPNSKTQPAAPAEACRILPQSTVAIDRRYAGPASFAVSGGSIYFYISTTRPLWSGKPPSIATSLRPEHLHYACDKTGQHMHPQTVYLPNYAHCQLSPSSATLQTDAKFLRGQKSGDYEVARNSFANSPKPL